MKRKKRVLIIGLDGGTWKILRPMMDKGYLPNLQNLVHAGSSGTLRSTVPPLTPVAWSSFVTGVNPGRHGVICFGKISDTFTSTGVVDRTAIKAQDIWRYLSQQGKRIVAINVPMTYPPMEINGIMVTGMFTPGRQGRCTWPPEFKEELFKEVPQYEIFPDVEEIRTKPRRDFKGFIQYLEKTMHYRVRAGLYLLQKEDWDLFMLHIQETDLLQHPLWGYLDPKHPLYDQKKYQYIVENFYARLDSYLGDMLSQAHAKAAHDDLLTVVLSDHGFAGNFRSVNLQRWMCRQGWSRLNQNPAGRVAHLIRQMDVLKLRRRLWRRNYRTEGARHNALPYDLDLSRALSTGTNVWGFIKYLNMDSPGREQLIKQLYDLRDPRNNQAIVARVIPIEDVCEGPEVGTFPDLILEPHDGYTFSRGGPHEPFIRSVRFKNNYHMGTHDLDGIIIVRGESIKGGMQLQASIMDLFPTVLCHLGLPVPEPVDGRIMDIFKEGYREIAKSGISQTTSEIIPEPGVNNDDQKEIESRLKAIGYL
ncbi:MAG: alkaline phosphatase family protein [Sedimentisphaerales bacterium]|nr:alkaline phosphatase family protein [Sedimentisphaerales bacterium]